MSLGSVVALNPGASVTGLVVFSVCLHSTIAVQYIRAVQHL